MSHNRVSRKRGGGEGIGEAEKVGENREEDENKGWRMAFWNVAGMGNKDRDFWGVLGKWDVMLLIETWVEENSWLRLKEKLSKGYDWEVQFARRKRKRGRTIGGMIMEIRRKMVERTKIKEEEGMIIGKIRCREKKWRVVGVYVKDDMERKLQRMEQWTEERDAEVKTIIGGRF